MAYYTQAIEKLDTNIRALINSRGYPSVHTDPSIFETQEVSIKNTDQIAFYERETQFIEAAISKCDELCSSVGIMKSEIDEHSVRLKVLDSINPRIQPEWTHPEFYFGQEHYDACQVLRNLVARLEKQIPPYTVLVELQKIYQFLLEQRDNSLRSLRGYQKGKTGEERVQRTLEKLAFKNIIRESVILPAMTADSETSETDAIAITPKGVFVLEVKNIGSAAETITIEPDGRWQRSKNGKVFKTYGTKGEFDRSPSVQNMIHKVNIQAFLASHGMDNVRLIPAVVMANNDVNVENKSNNAVIRFSELLTYIEEYDAPDTLSRNQMEQIAVLFDKYGLEEREFPAQGIVYNAEVILQHIENLKCTFLQQKNFELSVGQMLQQAVQDIYVAKTAEVEAEEQKRAEKIDSAVKNTIGFSKATVANIIRVPVVLLVFYLLRNELFSADWFRKALYEAGELAKSTAIVYSMGNKALYYSISLALLICAWIPFWLLPQAFQRFMKKHDKPYLVNMILHVVLAEVVCVVVVLILSRGNWIISLPILAIVMLSCYCARKGKFLLKKKECIE